MRDQPFNCIVGTNGNLLATTDGGLGCAPPDSITRNASLAPIYSNTQAYTGQTISLKMISDTGIPCYYEYSSSIVVSQANLYYTTYLYLTGNPGATLGICDLRSASSSDANIGISATGKLRLGGTAGFIAFSTASITLNAWIRVELDAAAGATGTLTARLYNSSDTLVETISGANSGGPVAFIKARIGPQTGVAAYTYFQTNSNLSATSQRGAYVAPTGGHTWYMSKNGDNSNGASYSTAWTDFDQLDKAKIAPGDTVIMDGGATRCRYTCGYDFLNHSTARPGLLAGMVYTAAGILNFSGTATGTITFKTSTDTGHNGTVVHFGGRTTLLPEANASVYANGGSGLGTGFDLRGSGYITIDGSHRGGFISYGWGNAVSDGVGHSEAIRLSATSNHITLRNLEWFDCGMFTTYALPSTGATVYKTSGTGCNLGGTNITIDRCLMHDCGEDTIQGTSAVSSLVMQYSWSYVRRAHSTYTGYGFNAGAQTIADQNTLHADGIQCYGGGLNQTPMTFNYNIFGPHINQGIYLGDAGQITSFDNVSISNCTFLAVFNHCIQGDTISGSTPANWTIDQCTMMGPNGSFPNYSSGWFAVELESGTGHSFTNNIVEYNGSLYLLSAFTGTKSGNIYNGTNIIPGGTNTDPGFAVPLVSTNNTPTFDDIFRLDLTPSASPAIGKGSAVTGITWLMNKIDSLNNDAPSYGRTRSTRTFSTRTFSPR